MSLVKLVKNLTTDWRDLLLEQSEELERISVEHERQKNLYEPDLRILPEDEDIFRAFKYFDMGGLKCVILGQDPYPNKSDAMGLSFSVPDGVKCPPSLGNIFKELENNFGKKRERVNLEDWAEQGVLLMNSSLTVLEGKSNINAKLWMKFTDKLIEGISRRCERVVFVLWGNNAIGKRVLVDESRHQVLVSVHPSPLSASRGFFGNNHFRLVNEYLSGNGKEEVKWIYN